MFDLVHIVERSDSLSLSWWIDSAYLSEEAANQRAEEIKSTVDEDGFIQYATVTSTVLDRRS